MILPKQNKPKKKVLSDIFLLAIFVALILVLSYLYFKDDINSLLVKRDIANPLPLFSEEERLRDTFNLVGFEISELGIFDTYYEATLSSRLIVVIGKDQDFSSQVASLQFILNRSKIEGKIPTKIDLRFDKPVLKY